MHIKAISQLLKKKKKILLYQLHLLARTKDVLLLHFVNSIRSKQTWEGVTADGHNLTAVLKTNHLTLHKASPSTTVLEELT